MGFLLHMQHGIWRIIDRMVFRQEMSFGRWVVFACLLSAALGDTLPPTTTCSKNEFNLDNQRCCGRCPPGQGATLPCSAENNTKCHPCTFGESYSPVSSHEEPCQPCSICPEYSQMVTPCNMTHDTICQCYSNYYVHPVSGKCRPCQFCPIEYGVRWDCNLTHDRVCARCPEGYYSDRLGTEPCKRCGICKMHQVMLQHCSPGQDTICIDIPTIRSTPWPSDSFTESSLNPGEEQTPKTNPIPIYCSILGALVFALVIYVIVKQNRRRQLMKNKGQNLSTSTSTESPPLLSALSSAPFTNSKHGSDSGVYVEQDRPVSSTTRIRDLPPIKRKALENSMHGCREDQGGWKSLARELGFSNPMISSIETRSHQDGFSPFRILLSEWGKRDTALVGTLVHALRAIRRDDCVRILCGDTREYIAPPKYVDLGSIRSQVL